MPDTKEQIADWVQKYTSELQNWAFYKTKQQALSEDIVQETFIAAYRNFEKFKGNSSPKTWLFSILRNKIADHYRSKFQQNIVRESDLKKEEDSSILDRFFDHNGDWLSSRKPSEWDTPEEELLDNSEFNKVLKECMEQLNEKSYLSIQYKYLEQKEGKDICKDLDITPSNFWQILHRAKLQLRDCIENNWFN